MDFTRLDEGKNILPPSSAEVTTQGKGIRMGSKGWRQRKYLLGPCDQPQRWGLSSQEERPRGTLEEQFPDRVWRS